MHGSGHRTESHAMKRKYPDVPDAPDEDGGGLGKMNLQPFQLTGTQVASRNKEDNEDSGGQDDWEVVSHRRNKKPKKVPKKESSNYPSITHSANSRLQTHVKISDLQALVLYILADGPSPQWVSIKNHKSIRRVVVIMAPGLEAGMFSGDIPLQGTSGDNESDKDRRLTQVASRSSESSPDSRYPV